MVRVETQAVGGAGDPDRGIGLPRVRCHSLAKPYTSLPIQSKGAFTVTATHAMQLKIRSAADPLPDAAATVMGGDIVILKGAVPADVVQAARQATLAWGMTAPSDRNSVIRTHTSTHYPFFLPAKATFRYIFHSHEFYFDGSEPAELAPVKRLFDAMRVIYEGLTGNRYEYTPNAEGLGYAPQCIQYPQGGGFFQEHVHTLLPQKIGLILSASNSGTDYELGGVRFHKEREDPWLETEGQHDLGDICLFRYDLYHDITPVDPDVPLDWTRDSGRWSFVLPVKLYE